MKFIPAVFGLLLLVPATTATPALADSKLDDIANFIDDCLARATATVENKQCNADALSQVDAYLNGVYGSIVAELKNPDVEDFEKKDNAEKLERLKLAQRAWISFRDAQCELEGADSLGGTNEGVLIGACLYQMTADRTKALIAQFQAEQ